MNTRNITETKNVKAITLEPGKKVGVCFPSNLCKGELICLNGKCYEEGSSLETLHGL